VAQVDIRRPVTAEARVQSQFSPRDVCGRPNDKEKGYSPSTSVFPSQYHSNNPSYSSLTKEERVKLGKFRKNNNLSENNINSQLDAKITNFVDN